MKLAAFADLHLDMPFRWAGPDLARARRSALRRTLERIVEVSAAESADALLSAGDLYEHENYAPDTGAFLRAVFAEFPGPVYLAPGNHDFFGPSSLYATVDWPPNVHLFTSPRLSPVGLADGVQLWGGAHRRPRGTGSFLDSFSTDGDGVHVALFHGSERSCAPLQGGDKEVHAEFDSEDIPRAGLAFAVVGHFHKPVDRTYFAYPGNPEPLAFGEVGTGGLLILDVAEDGTVRYERRRVAGTDVRDVRVDVTDCDSGAAVRARVAEHLAGLQGLVRLDVVGDVPPEVDLKPQDFTGIAPWLDAVVPRISVQVLRDLDELRKQPTVEGVFVRDVLSADLDSEMRRRVLTTGLRALAGRTDLEVV